VSEDLIQEALNQNGFVDLNRLSSLGISAECYWEMRLRNCYSGAFIPNHFLTMSHLWSTIGHQ